MRRRVGQRRVLSLGDGAATRGGAGGEAATAGEAGAGGAAGASGSGGAIAGAGGFSGLGDGSGTGGAEAGAAAPGGNDGSVDGDAGGTDAGGAKPVWDWVGIVGSGQSLSVGQNATNVSATRQPYHNLMLSLGTATVPPFNPSSGALSMVPLVEPLRKLATSYPSAYPVNIYGETPHTAMGSQITELYQHSFGGDYVTIHTAVGENGQPMTAIQKGATDMGTTGRAYAATLFEAAAIERLAGAAGKTYGIGAIVLTHGESDAGNTSYEADLVRLWTDYNQDLRKLTGQTASIPMLLSQQQSTPDGKGQRSASLQAEWRVGVDHASDIICSGPKYQYTYSDHLHLTTREYERLGEKYAQVYFERAVLGHAWQPLQPSAASRAGRVITVAFHVPVPPMVWDTVLPPPHQTAFPEWAQGHGFEVRTASGNVALTSVTITGDAVEITCASDLPASGVIVGYAMTADGTPPASGTARWGQLRDSDPFVGAMTASPQPNYGLSFEMPVP